MKRRALPSPPACAVLSRSSAAACGLPRLAGLPHPSARADHLRVRGRRLPDHGPARPRGPRRARATAQMPQSIRDAAVAIEDRRFYWHHGFDLQAIIARPPIEDAAAGQIVEGGSTITQQLVKNLYVGGSPTPSGARSTRPSLAWQLEDRLTKEQILTKYLNTVYFGEGAYGVRGGGRRPTSPSTPATSSLAESAMLAGLITAPEPLRPLPQPPSRARAAQRGPAPDATRRAIIDAAGYRATRCTSPSPCTTGPRADASATRYPYFVDYFKRWFLTNPAFGATYERPQAAPVHGRAARRHDDPRPQPAGAPPRRRCARSWPTRATPTRALTAHRPTHRLRARHGGRQGRRLLVGRGTRAA